MGQDLPGAVYVTRGAGDFARAAPTADDDLGTPSDEPLLRFSLAGVQLKFSAVAAAGGGLTIPARGVGGDWILKLPSLHYAGVPENEYSVMRLAAHAGIEVPETRLVPLEQVVGLPQRLLERGMPNEPALAVRRYDRTTGGRVHAEDFAQVFGQRPQDKYGRYTCADIATMVAAFCDDRSVEEYARRLMYSALVGNGDMHTKNWSLIYRDGRTAELSPAYDLLCTKAYIPEDEPALRIGKARRWQSLGLEDFSIVADAARVSGASFVRAATETAERFQDVWRETAKSLPLSDAVRETIERQLVTVPAILGMQRIRRVPPRHSTAAARPEEPPKSSPDM